PAPPALTPRRRRPPPWRPRPRGRAAPPRRPPPPWSPPMPLIGCSTCLQPYRGGVTVSGRQEWRGVGGCRGSRVHLLSPARPHQDRAPQHLPPLAGHCHRLLAGRPTHAP